MKLTALQENDLMFWCLCEMCQDTKEAQKYHREIIKRFRRLRKDDAEHALWKLQIDGYDSFCDELDGYKGPLEICLTEWKDHTRKAVIDRYLEGITFISSGLSAECKDCRSNWNIQDDDIEGFNNRIKNGRNFDEGAYSSSSCEVCGGLPGKRHVFHGRMNNNEIVHLDVCEDCREELEDR